MANDLDKIKTTEFQRWNDKLRRDGARAEWRKVMPILGGDAAFLQRGALFGTSHFSAQSAGSDPTAEDLDTTKNVVASVAYEKLHKVTRKDRRDNPEITADVTNMMVDAALSSIANLAWTTYDALATTAHPGDQAPFIGGAGGSDPAYFADTYTAPVAQSNLLTTALSASALSTAIATLQDYKNPAGIPANINVDNTNLQLVVGSALRATAYDLVDARREGGGTTESGFAKGIEVVVDNYQIDANDWVLQAKSHSPVKMWVRQPPRLYLSERFGHLYYYAEFESAVVLEPLEMGIIFNAVA